MLCHKRGKKVAIAFLAHGTSKRKAESHLSWFFLSLAFLSRCFT
jgi:hypothetical protein